MRKFLLRVLGWAGALLLVVILVLVARGMYAFRDRVPGYTVDLRIDAAKSRLSHGHCGSGSGA